MLASKITCDNTYSNKEVGPSRLFHLGLWDHFSRCRCVGALAPLPLVLLGSGGLFCLALVCGCTCAPPSAIPFSPTCGLTPSLSNEQRYRSPPVSPTALIRFAARNSRPRTQRHSPPPLRTPAGIEDLYDKIVSVSSSPGYLKLSEYVHASSIQRL